MEEREPQDTGEDEELFDLSEEEAGERKKPLNADYLLDRVIPGEIDWRDLVRRHPLASVGVAATIGLLLGRRKGQAIVTGLSAALTGAVMRQLSDVFDGDIFEF
jgi:hypothetical protein